MKNFKIINNQTWDIDKIKAENKKATVRIFKEIKRLKTFNENIYSVVEENHKPRKNYSEKSFSQFEQSLFYNRK